MLTAPTSTNHHETRAARTRPNIPAAPKQVNAARFTAAAEASPDATNRIGPTRTLSVPRIPSL